MTGSEYAYIERSTRPKTGRDFCRLPVLGKKLRQINPTERTDLTKALRMLMIHLRCIACKVTDRSFRIGTLAAGGSVGREFFARLRCHIPVLSQRLWPLNFEGILQTRMERPEEGNYRAAITKPYGHLMKLDRFKLSCLILFCSFGDSTKASQGTSEL